MCALRQNQHFDSASVVKVTILGALLRTAMEQHKYLTSTQVSLTTAMITRSDNNTASTLWARLGRGSLQHFLNLAKMTQTRLGPGGYWGLTQIPAHDELTLLRLLTSTNSVLNAASRAYALGLMARVIPYSGRNRPPDTHVSSQPQPSAACSLASSLYSSSKAPRDGPPSAARVPGST